MRLKVRKSLTFGVCVLVVVVLLWVGSAALSRYLYTEGHYNKPFFTTYFKTSLLSIYLIAFVFWPPWHHLCCCQCGGKRGRVKGQMREWQLQSEEREASMRLRRQQKEERRALLEEEDSDSWKQKNKIKNGKGLPEEKSSKIICVKVTASGMEEAHNFDAEEWEEKGAWFDKSVESSGEGSVAGASNEKEVGVSGRGRSGRSQGDNDDEECRKNCPVPIMEGSGDKLYLVGCLKSRDRRTPNRSSSSPQANLPPAAPLPTTSHLAIPPPATPPPATPPRDSPSSQSQPHPQCILMSSSDHQTLHYRGTCNPNPDRDSPAALKGACSVAHVSSSPTEGGACPVMEEVCPIGEEVCPIGEMRRNSNCPFLRYYKLKTCTLGPPENQPLCCDSEGDAGGNAQALRSCRSRCNKVSFCSQVEVREMRKSHEESLSSARKFDKKRDIERHACRLPRPILPVHHVMILSLVFGIVWFFANYLYSAALSHSSVAVVNTMSATSGVFVMVLAGLPCLTVTDGDRFTIPRCLVTLVSVTGAILVALSSSGKDDEDDVKNGAILGAVLALGGSILYALYLVLLRRCVKDTESLEIPMFFGFVGLFDFILLLPMLVLWHYVHVETFEIPPSNNIWTLLLVNGLAGTVLSELLWLWGVFLTSPLLGTLALSLVTPLSITYSILTGDALFSWMFVLGAILIFLAFVGVVILEHLGTWDPIWKLLKNGFSFSGSGLRNSSPSIESGFLSPPP